MKKFLLVYEFADRMGKKNGHDPLWDFSRDVLLQKFAERGKTLKFSVARGIFKKHQDGGTSAKRLANFFYMHAAVLFEYLSKRPDVVFVRTTPPLIQIPYLFFGKLFGAKVYVWLMDYHPVFGLRSSKKGSPKYFVWKFFDILDRLALKLAAGVVCLDTAMSELIRERSPKTKTFVCPTFSLKKVDFLDLSNPREKVDTVSLLYSGNLGRAHNTEKLEKFLSALSKKTEVELAFSGMSDKSAARLAAVCEASGTHFKRFPFVKNYADLGAFYKKNGFDYGIVLLNDELRGVVSPSKFSGYSSFGLPVINIGPKGTNADTLCERFGAGISFDDVSEIDAVIERILNPATQPELARNTENSLEYFSPKAAERLADFWLSELDSKA